MAEEDNNKKSPIQELAAELRKQTGSSRKSVTSQTDIIDVTKKIGESVVKIEQMSKISHIKHTGLLENIEQMSKMSHGLFENIEQLSKTSHIKNAALLENIEQMSKTSHIKSAIDLLESIEQLSKTSHIKNAALLEDIRDSLVGSATAETQHKKEEGRKSSLVGNALTNLSKLPAAIKGALDNSRGSGGGGGQKGSSLIGDALGKMGLGNAMKGVGSGLADAAKSIAMMGLAIPAFLGGLAVGSTVLEAANGAGFGDLDFAGLKKGMTGLSSMITSLDEKTLIVLGGLIGLSAFAGIKGSKGTDAALSLSLMGMSLTAFLGGLAVGSTILGAAASVGFADLDFVALKKGFSGLGEMITSLDQSTLLVLGGMIGLAGFAGAKAGTKVATSIALMGISLTAFIGGLALGNKILEGEGGDMEHLKFTALKKAFKGLSSSIGDLSTKAMIALGGLIGVSAVFSKVRVNPLKFATTMSMMGVSIVGFLGGLALGELALGAAGGVGIDLNFPSLKDSFKGFSNIVGSLTPASIIALGGIIGAAAFASRVTQSPLKFGGSMLMIGLGIVGLLGGFAIGETLLAKNSASLDLDFPMIKSAVSGFGAVAEAISLPAIAVLGGLVASATLLSRGGFATGAKFASAMIFIGAGVVGLLGGFAVGETLLAKNSASLDLDFPMIKSAVSGFSNVMGAVDTKAIAGLGTIMATAVLLSKGGFATGAKLASAMIFIGAGVAGLLGGFAIGETLLATNGTNLDLEFTTIKKAVEGFNGVAEAISLPAVTVLGGLVASAVLLSKGGFASGAKFASAMVFIGTGIAGLLGGFVIGETALANVDLATLQFDKIKASMEGFSNVMGAVDIKAITGLGAIMATAVLLSKGGFADGPKFALAMTFIGAGIAGFLGGLAVGDAALTALDGSVVDLNFTSMKKAFIAFDDLLGSLSSGTLAAMTGLMVAGGVLTLITGFGGGPAFALAMTGIGAGIGGFLVGFDGVAAAGGALGLDGSAIADLMKNVAKGAAEFDGIDMVALSAGIGLLGPAMLLLMGSEGIGGIAEGATNFLKKITGQKEDDGGIFGKISRTLGDPKQLDMDAISQLTKSIDDKEVTSFTNSIDKITKSLSAFAGDDGFWASVGGAITGLFKDDPFKPFLKLAEKGNELFRAGLGVEKITAAMGGGETNNYDKKMLNSIVDFAKDIGKEQDKLDNAAKSLRSIAHSFEKISQLTPPTGNIVGGGYDAVMGSEEMRTSQDRLSTNQASSSKGGGSSVIVGGSDNSTVNNTTMNSFTSPAPPSSRDYYDYNTAFKSTR